MLMIRVPSAVRRSSLRQLKSSYASFHSTARPLRDDPRLKDDNNAHIISDDFASIRSEYDVPKNTIVLAHGLLGFDELHVVPAFGSWKVPGIKYWSGITEALTAKGVDVIIANVPPSGSIENRAAKLAEKIKTAAEGKAINVIAGMSILKGQDYAVVLTLYSGLDSRYMISQLKDENLNVKSLTTIATPHHGSTFADYLFKQLGTVTTDRLYAVLRTIGFTDTAGFAQLTQTYMNEKFNPAVQDDRDVRYFSYGAQLSPHLTSVFRFSHAVIAKVEGENDGLVSVESSRWGEYKGTLENVSHLDLINWTNKMRWWIKEMMLGADGKSKFNAIAFYLAIADMLAKEGL